VLAGGLRAVELVGILEHAQHVLHVLGRQIFCDGVLEAALVYKGLSRAIGSGG